MESAHHSLSKADCNNTADVPSFTLRNALSHLFLICVALYHESRLVLHKLCQIPKNSQYKWLMVSSSAPGTSMSTSGSSGKFLLYTGSFVTTVLQNLVSQQRIDGCCMIHFLHWELFSAAIKTSFFRFGHDCTSTATARSPCYLRLQADTEIWVFRKVRVDTVLTRTRFHFCSRLHW